MTEQEIHDKIETVLKSAFVDYVVEGKFAGLEEVSYAIEQLVTTKRHDDESSQRRVIVFVTAEKATFSLNYNYRVASNWFGWHGLMGQAKAKLNAAPDDEVDKRAKKLVQTLLEKKYGKALYAAARNCNAFLVERADWVEIDTIAKSLCEKLLIEPHQLTIVMVAGPQEIKPDPQLQGLCQYGHELRFCLIDDLELTVRKYFYTKEITEIAALPERIDKSKPRPSLSELLNAKPMVIGEEKSEPIPMQNLKPQSNNIKKQKDLDTTNIYYPTDLANYARLGSCPKYLERLSESKKTTKSQNTRDARSTADPYYKIMGALHEKAFEEHLEDLCFIEFPEEKRDDKNEPIYPRIGDILEKCSSKTCNSDDKLYAKEVVIKGEINGLEVSGRIDFLLFHCNEGKLILTIVECKASTADKPYQRVQASIYWMLLKKQIKNPKFKCCKKAIEIRVMVVRQSQKTLKHHTFELQGDELKLAPAEQGEEPDDDYETLPQPHIEEAELNALECDMQAIVGKLNSPEDESYNLAPRCATCTFTKDCLQQAKEDFNITPPANVPQAIKLLAYHLQARKQLEGKTKANLEEKGKHLHPPVKDLMEVRKNYYKSSLAPQIKPLNDSRHLPDPTESDPIPFYQIFINTEANPINGNRLGLIGLTIIPHPTDKNQKKAEHVFCNATCEEGVEKKLLEDLILKLKNIIDAKFYAHFYFWSRTELKLLVNACERVATDDALKLLHWLSRHELLREEHNYVKKKDGTLEDTLEELSVSCLQEEFRKCFAHGSLGQTLLEIATLNWPSSKGPAMRWTCRNDAFLSRLEPLDSLLDIKDNLYYSDALKPSFWKALNDTSIKDALTALQNDIKKRLNALVELETRIRGKGGCTVKLANKATNTKTPLPEGNPKEKTLKEASREAVLIEALIKKKKWLAEVDLATTFPDASTSLACEKITQEL